MEFIQLDFEGKEYFFHVNTHVIKDSNLKSPSSKLDQNIRDENTVQIYRELRELPAQEKLVHAGIANYLSHNYLALLLVEDFLSSITMDPVELCTIVSVLNNNDRSQEAIMVGDFFLSLCGKDNGEVLLALENAYRKSGNDEKAEECKMRSWVNTLGGKKAGARDGWRDAWIRITRLRSDAKIELELAGEPYFFVVSTHEIVGQHFVKVAEDVSAEVRRKGTEEIYEVLKSKNDLEKNTHLELAAKTRHYELAVLLADGMIDLGF